MTPEELEQLGPLAAHHAAVLQAIMRVFTGEPDWPAGHGGFACDVNDGYPRFHIADDPSVVFVVVERENGEQVVAIMDTGPPYRVRRVCAHGTVDDSIVLPAAARN